MKIKIIKDSEIVVGNTEYYILQQTYRQYGEIIDAINGGYAVYYACPHEDCIMVKMFNNGCNFPIKKFDSDDPEYNRICAEELVELLNQK